MVDTKKKTTTQLIFELRSMSGQLMTTFKLITLDLLANKKAPDLVSTNTVAPLGPLGQYFQSYLCLI